MTITTTEAQKKQEKLRRKRWEKAEKPYFRCCLKCSLSCSMTIQHGAYSYDIFNCPRENRGEPTFPYKWAEMLKERYKMVFCNVCGKEMKYLETRRNNKTGKPAKIYRCDEDDLVLAVEGVQ